MIGKCDDDGCMLSACACRYALVRTPYERLQERVAVALEWPIRSVVQMSLSSLRDNVRFVDQALADELSEWIRTGRHITGR